MGTLKPPSPLKGSVGNEKETKANSQRPPSPLKGSVGKDEGKKFKGSRVQVFLSRIRELENFFGAQWDFDKN